MPVTQRRNRKQIRHSVGLLLGAVKQDGGAIESRPTEQSANAARIVDNALAFGADNEHRGRWVFATDPQGVSHVRRVFASSRDERSITVSQPFASAPDSDWTYELWEADVSPATVHECINQAISGVVRKGSVETVDESFHTGGLVNAFAVSSAWSGVNGVAWRSRYVGVNLSGLNEPLSGLSPEVTVSADSADRREGAAAAKLDISAAASVGEDLAEVGFVAVDGRGYDRIEFWHKTDVQTTSSNIVLQLRQGSSAQESLPVPASVPGEWRYASVPLVAPEQNNAVSAVRFATGSSDAGEMTAWFDDVKLVRANSELWHQVPREFWRTDPVQRKVLLTDQARIPYARLRISGVRAPALLETDSDLCEVDSQYAVNAAAAGVLRSRGDRRGAVLDASVQQANLYEQLAQAARLRMSTPANVRWLND